jgi:hypothetical protein
MAVPEVVTHVAEAWSDVYGDHTSLSVLVLFGHIAGLLVAGGSALAADRLILDASRGGDAVRVLTLDRLARVHRTVVAGLALVVASGLLMTLADLDAFLAARVFYLKGALFVLLLANGAVLVTGERAARGEDPTRGWRILRATAVVSSVLWLTIAFLGVVLTKTA